jgi:hypothetical protein
MSNRYPSVRITPADVVEFSQAQGQHPSVENAERWLSCQKRCIEQMMAAIIDDNLDKIFGEATLMAYPDPVFDKQYKDIDEAIVIASDAFGQKMNVEQNGCSYQERDMLEVVQEMLAQPAMFSACIAYSQEFGKLGESLEETVTPLRTERVHLTCEGGRVTAEVVVENACEHGREVFIPEKQVDRMSRGF